MSFIIVEKDRIAYYDDYIDNRIVHDVLRQRYSNIPGMLYLVLWHNIDFAHPNGTFPWDVVTGMNELMVLYNSAYGSGSFPPYLAVYGLSPVFIQVKNVIASGKPVILGLTEFYPWATGNPYGEHWVVAYAYSSDGLNSYYKVVDGWANMNKEGVTFPIESLNYKKVINDSWTTSYITLSSAS